VKVADCPSVHSPFEAGRRFESYRGRSFLSMTTSSEADAD